MFLKKIFNRNNTVETFWRFSKDQPDDPDMTGIEVVAKDKNGNDVVVSEFDILDGKKILDFLTAQKKESIARERQEEILEITKRINIADKQHA